jgi:hypothetical protein
MVGTELAKIIDDYFAAKHSGIMQYAARKLVKIPAKKSGCSCSSLEAMMNKNGVSWARKNKSYIVEHLFRNAVKYSSLGIAALAEPAVRELAGSWVDEAVRRSEENVN